jgi:diaminohydroxyphosphoribosylaminopyrimidine deaminase / 5-amino-6-(5-phosphoribosylamino)uracil reductase
MSNFMKQALELAEKGRKTVSPNPLVGCVIVKNGKIIGEGYHQKAGENHAEIVALKNCTEDPTDATMYVTLEPCSHYGRTPPCVDKIIEARIAEVIIPHHDPNVLVNGEGIKKLEEAGIKVTIGMLAEQAQKQNKVFLKHTRTKMPFVYLKAAITLDGKIATKTFDSKWITSEISRQKVHELRSEVDAILIGKNTALADNPRLNARLEEVTYPTRVIVDKDDDLPENLQVFNQEGKTYVLTSVISKKENRITCLHENGIIDLRDALQKLGELGIQSLLVEGGGNMITQFTKQKLVDEFMFFIAPKVLGDDNAISFFSGQDIDSIHDGIHLEFTDVEKSGPDIILKGRYVQ